MACRWVLQRRWEALRLLRETRVTIQQLILILNSLQTLDYSCCLSIFIIQDQLIVLLLR